MAKEVWKVKVIDLDRLAKIAPGFGGAEGWYDPATGTLYIDKTLPSRPRPTMRGVLEHEKVHGRLHRAGVEIKPQGKAEALADALGLCATPSRYTNSTEDVFRKMLCSKWKWSKIDDRKKIVRRVLRLLQIKQTDRMVECLASETGLPEIK